MSEEIKKRLRKLERELLFYPQEAIEMLKNLDDLAGLGRSSISKALKTCVDVSVMTNRIALLEYKASDSYDADMKKIRGED